MPSTPPFSAKLRTFAPLMTGMATVCGAAWPAVVRLPRAATDKTVIAKTELFIPSPLLEEKLAPTGDTLAGDKETYLREASEKPMMPEFYSDPPRFLMAGFHDSSHPSQRSYFRSRYLARGIGFESKNDKQLRGERDVAIEGNIQPTGTNVFENSCFSEPSACRIPSPHLGQPGPF